MSIVGTLTLPVLTLESVGYPEEVEYLGLSMCLSNLAVSQLCKYKFDSMVKFGDVYVGAGPDGIFTLEDSDTFDGGEIDSVVELPLTDLGVSYQKRLRKIHVGFETNGSLKVTVSNDEGNEREYTLTPLNTSNLQHGSRVSVNRDGKGRYWKLRLENIDGCDFSLDSIEVIPIILARKPSGL
ncbi:MAG: hypothetical protein EHM49_00890 [Deltaproteobacteria bacterium]|nr:MAG: hypothetical protein EHM49_00890 [Deltaproteobacteria bacterium]